MNLAHAGSYRARGMVVVAMMISLVLMAAVAFAMQRVQQVVDAREREALTLARMERIRTALCAYHKLNSAFPPSPTPPPTPTPAYANHIYPVGWLASSGDAQGWLKPLGLSIEDVTDGWGRLISVRSGADCNSNTLYVDPDGDGTQTSANACVVLISHGRTGRGGLLPRAVSAGLAWVGPAPTNPGTTAQGSGAEWRNTLSTSGGTGQPPYQAAAPQAGCTGGPRDDPGSPCHFDDIVRYFDNVGNATPTDLCSS